MNEIKNDVMDSVLKSLDFELIEDTYKKDINTKTKVSIRCYKDMHMIIIQVETMFLKCLCEFGAFHSFFTYEFIFDEKYFKKQVEDVIEKIQKISEAIEGKR